jgi:hypothetical protein
MTKKTRIIWTVWGSAVLMQAGSAWCDTPEKLTDPEALRQSLPWLASQAHWTDNATPEEIALFDGPETKWKTVPESEYDLSGFNPAILGSPVPAPGVHPRVLFSPEDLPGIRERFIGSKNHLTARHIFETQLWNPEAPDYQWYHKLATGDVDDMEFEDPYKGPNARHRFKGLPTRMYITHTPYIPRILAAAAAYALYTGDESLSRELATVVANYYTLREKLVDAHIERSTPEYIEKYKRGEVELEPWPNDLWRGMALMCGGDNVGLAYDYTANWMTDAQRDLMRRYITKATTGRRAYGQNGPIRWRDTNWVGWDLNFILTALAIEGEEGFDPELLKVAEETVDGYMTFGISPKGTILETNGKNGAGYDFALKAAVALARRGHRNFFGHPHLRALSVSQIHQIAPDGVWNVNNGTYGGSRFNNGSWLAAAYPRDPAHRWMLLEGITPEPENLEEYAFRLKASPQELKEKGLAPVGRIHCAVMLDDWMPVPSVTLPGGRAAWEREHLGLPLDFEDPVHGQMTMRSGNDRDALFMMVEARPDLYVGGHQHHDAGHFYLAAHGEKWGIESDRGRRASLFHSVVLIDGKGQGSVQDCAPTRVEWLGADTSERAAFARMNLKNGYDAIWTTPMHYSWAGDEVKSYTWRPETDPYVVNIFKGTQDYKARVWMHSYWNWNWGPTMRAEYNPVEKAFRTAGIVRGPNPYALIVDDIRKDDQVRLYEWVMQVPADRAMVAAHRQDPREVILTARENFTHAGRQDQVKRDASCLLVRVIEAAPEPGATRFDFTTPLIRLDRIKDADGQRLIVSSRSVEPRFKILLVPFRWGGERPAVDVKDGVASISWKDQQDEVLFSGHPDGRTRLAVKRDGVNVLQGQ